MLRNNLNMRATFALVLASLAAVALCDLTNVRRDQSTNTDQTVVKGLDLQKYSGRWYEIAYYRSVFELPNVENTRANYSVRADGNLDFIIETFPIGKSYKMGLKGYAYKADPKSEEAKFKLIYTHYRYFVGDYWVLYVDDEYQYAIVGGRLRVRLHILSRKNKIDEQVYNQLVQKAKEQGYEVQKLVKTPQTDPPPP